MAIRPIRTEADYDWAFKEILQYFEEKPEPGTPAAERFEALAAAFEAYEAKKWPIERSGRPSRKRTSQKVMPLSKRPMVKRRSAEIPDC